MKNKVLIMQVRSQLKDYSEICHALISLREDMKMGIVSPGKGLSEQVSDCDALLETVRGHLKSLETTLNDLMKE